ncbi:12472_t:CDS:2, partial [Ambispora leptoticha]
QAGTGTGNREQAGTGTGNREQAGTGTEPDQPPQKPKPTPEQVNEAKNELSKAVNSDKKEDLVSALNKVSDTVKNSLDEDLKKEKEKVEDKLGQVDPNDATEVKKIRTEVLNDGGLKALEKLISEVEQAIKSGDKKKIEAKVKKLRQFTEDTTDEYAQNAYRLKKTKVQELFEKTKNYSTQNSENKKGFFRMDNPLM